MELRLPQVSQDSKNPIGIVNLICTPKVRHFRRCIFFMQKRRRENRRYSIEFKISVIMDMREHHLGYNETVRKYWDINQRQEENYKNIVKSGNAYS